MPATDTLQNATQHTETVTVLHSLFLNSPCFQALPEEGAGFFVRASAMTGVTG